MRLDFKRELGKITPYVEKGAKIYVFGCGANWEVICNAYNLLAGISIDDYVDAFIDNDCLKQGGSFHNKSILSIESVDLTNSVILLSVAGIKTFLEIANLLSSLGLIYNSQFFGSHIFTNILLSYENERLSVFKNIHRASGVLL